MKSQKKSFIKGAVAIIIAAVVLSLGLVAGCGPHGFREKTSWRHSTGWMEDRFHDKDFPEHIMKRMDSRVEDLDLSETQKKKYEEIRQKIQSSLTRGFEERKTLMEELKKEINRETPDMNAMTGLVKKRLEDRPGSMEENLDLFVEFYNILDEDQKAHVIKMIRKRIGKD